MAEPSTTIIAPLFNAWRAQASGVYSLVTEAGESKVFLQGGKIVQVEGIPGLLSSPDGAARLKGELLADLGAVVAKGVSVDAAMTEAAEKLGQHVVEALEMPAARAGFEVGVSAPPGAFPLPTPLPRLLVQALRAHRPLDSVKQALRPVRRRSVRAVSGEAARALDPAGLRIFKRCQAGGTFEEIVAMEAGAGAARAATTWRTLDMLLILGLIEVGEAVEEATAAPPPRQRVRRAPQPPKVLTPDEVAAEHLALAARMKSLHALQALGIPADEPTANITRQRVDQAFRAMAQAYHPDRHAGQPAVVQEAISQLFAVISDKAEELAEQPALDEAKARQAAEQRGEIYVSEMDAEKAKVLHRRAEQAERSRAWAHGREVLAEAAALDPNNPDVKVLDAFYAVVLKELEIDAALKIIQAQPVRTGRSRAEAAYRVGRLLRLAEKDTEALKAFKSALEHNPGHMGAERELRLLQRRAADARR